MGAAVVGALLIGIPQTTSGALAQVLLAVIVLVPLSSFEGVVELTPAAAQLVRSAQAATRICALLEDEAPLEPHDIPDGQTVIEAHDLSIGWPGGPTLASGISLTLRPGSSMAVVGASGIGKTTLLATLTGVIPPKSGSALINGVPAWGTKRDQLTNHITMTAEDAHVFATTIYENLRVAHASLTRDEASGSTVITGLSLEGDKGLIRTQLLIDLADRLYGLGLEVVANIGIPGGLRIPLAIGHPEVPGRLLLAVLTDDDEYVAQPSLRVRDRLWPSMLEEQGWKVHIALSMAVFIDPAKETDRIVQLVLDAVDEINGPAAPVLELPEDPDAEFGVAEEERNGNDDAHQDQVKIHGSGFL